MARSLLAWSMLLVILLFGGCDGNFESKSRTIIVSDDQIATFHLTGYRWPEVFEEIVTASGLTINAGSLPNKPAGDLHYQNINGFPELLEQLDADHAEFRILQPAPGVYLVQPAGDPDDLI